MSDDTAIPGAAGGQLPFENIEQTDQFRRLGFISSVIWHTTGTKPIAVLSAFGCGLPMTDQS